MLLYEWTPAINDRAAAKERLVRIAYTLEQEVFTADASIFLVNRSEAATERTLAVLRENALFPPLQITAGLRGTELAVTGPKQESLPAPAITPARPAAATPIPISSKTNGNRYGALSYPRCRSRTTKKEDEVGHCFRSGFRFLPAWHNYFRCRPRCIFCVLFSSDLHACTFRQMGRFEVKV